MEWSLAHPLHDVDDIVELADTIFGQEVDGILNRDRNVFRHRLTMAATEQLFNKGKEFLAVCRGDGYVAKGGFYAEQIPDQLLGYCWFDRGGYTTYSNEEICNAKFHHVDLSLPAKQRVKIINQMIDQQILWAYSWGIPIICSTSIRGDHKAFMKMHEKRGFRVNGSYAWIRTEKAVELLNEPARNVAR